MINSKFHENPGLGTAYAVFSTFEGYNITDSSRRGCLTRTFVKIFGDSHFVHNRSLRACRNILKYKLKRIDFCFKNRAHFNM